MPSIKMTSAEIDRFVADCRRKGIDVEVKQAKTFPLPDDGPLAKWFADNRDDEAYVCVMVPIKAESRDNMSANWRARKALVDRQRNAIDLACRGILESIWTELAQGCTVRLVRIAPRTLDDDNLRGSVKALRDWIAQRLFGGDVGKRDSDPRVTWQYDQIKGPPKTYGVLLTINKR